MSSESYETVSAAEMREIEAEVMEYSPHDLKIMKIRTKNELREIKNDIDAQEGTMFDLERQIKKTELMLDELKSNFMSDKAELGTWKDEHRMIIRKQILIDEAEEEEDQVPKKTKYIVEECIPYILQHADKSENVNLDTFVNGGAFWRADGVCETQYYFPAGG